MNKPPFSRHTDKHSRLDTVVPRWLFLEVRKECERLNVSLSEFVCDTLKEWSRKKQELAQGDSR